MKTPIIRLANRPGTERMEPSNFPVLEKVAVDLIRRSEDLVVWVGGIEFLLSNNPPRRVLSFLHAPSDEAGPTSAWMLITLDPQVLSAQELAPFERELEVMQTD